MASDVIVGFIGLGTMGGKMATNLLKAGYRVVVHDLHRQSAGHHLQAGSAWADTPRALAEQSDVVFTSLPPVSGGPSGAASGKMAIWVGGDPPDFALKLATKDVALATALGRELGVPMRICNLTYAEMPEIHSEDGRPAAALIGISDVLDEPRG